MGLLENAILSLVKAKLNRSLDLSGIKEIPSDGIHEIHNIPYTNRSGKELLMDIFMPEVSKGTELPVIINIHGGALIILMKVYLQAFTWETPLEWLY